MGQRAEVLSKRLKTFNDEVIAFVKTCSDVDWKKICDAEEWTVGVTARHIGAGHYEAIGIAGMIVDGETLPPLTMEQIVEMANRHAREHATCTREEVLEILRRNGKTMVEFVTGLDDAALDRKAFLKAMDGEITTEQFLENVILMSAGEHFDGMINALLK